MRVRRPSSVSSLSAECPSGRRSQRIGTEVRGPAQRPPHRSPGRPQGAGAGRAAGGGIGGGAGRGGALPGRACAARGPLGHVPAALVSVSLICCAFFFLSLSLPALRTHNLTVLPSHNSASVPANDSAYSNLSATVGEHVPVPHPPAARRGPRSRPRPVPSGSV